MPNRCEIRKETNALRSGLRQRNEQLAGSCYYAVELAKTLEGWVYVTETPSEYGLDHKVAIARIKKTPRGQVIDVTLEQPFVGEVTNVFDFKQTALEISSLFGIQGWSMCRNYFRS